MINKIKYCILLVATLSGCAGYSMHSIYDVAIQVKDYESNKPISAATVSVTYDYDSYGWFYFGNKPEPVTGITNNKGEVVLALADYRYRILMDIAGEPASLNKNLVQNGGSLAVPRNKPVFTVVLEPKQPNH